ncbi:hypothetical protein [Ruegeria atlantica]|nr:hypothetical protein [Ruegeria atlantica]
MSEPEGICGIWTALLVFVAETMPVWVLYGKAGLARAAHWAYLDGE